MQGVVTLVAMSAPVVISLLVLMRLTAARTEVTMELEKARDLAEEQTLLLRTHQPPTEPLPKLLARTISFTPLPSAAVL